MILNLTNAKFKTSNLTTKLYKYVRIFSLQAAQKLAMHINLRHNSKKLHENEFGKQILLCSPNLYQTS